MVQGVGCLWRGADVKACVQMCQLCTPVDVLDLCSHLSVHQSFHPTGIFSRHFIASYLPQLVEVLLTRIVTKYTFKTN